LTPPTRQPLAVFLIADVIHVSGVRRRRGFRADPGRRPAPLPAGASCSGCCRPPWTSRRCACSDPRRPA